MPDQSLTYLRVTLYDKSKVALGKVKMDLDWVRSQWSVREDEGCWDKVGYSKQGRFEHKDWGVLWIWDQGNANTMILWDAPNRDKDLVYNSGDGTLFAPKTPAMKDCGFEWTKLTAPLSIREEVRALLRANLPASGLKEPANWLEPTVGRKKDATGATGCGGMPGTVIRKLGEERFIRDIVTLRYEQTVNVYDPQDKKKVIGTKKEQKTTDCRVRDFMTGWKEFSLGLEKKSGVAAGTHWTDFRKDTSKSPKPGDILVTMDENRNFAHVCVVYDVNGDNWRTGDGGQGEGFAIGFFDKVVDRKTRMIKGQYKNVQRWVDGWVDLESLLVKK